MFKRGIIASVIALAWLAAAPAQAAFSWNDLGGQIEFQAISVSPDPLNTGGALPLRFDVYYNAVTNEIINSAWVLGAPTPGDVPAGAFVAVFPGSLLGSATYTYDTPITIAAGNYVLPPTATDDGGSLAFNILVPTDVEISRLEISFEKKILGVWSDIPGLPFDGIDGISFAISGDYYIKAQMLDAESNLVGGLEMYFTNSGLDQRIAPIHYIAVTPDAVATPEPASLALFSLTGGVLLLAGRRRRM